MATNAMTKQEKIALIQKFKAGNFNKKLFAQANGISVVTFTNMLNSYEKDGEKGLENFLNPSKDELTDWRSEKAEFIKIISEYLHI